MPVWHDMDEDEKLDFLNKWCENLSRAQQQLGAHLQGLHERLRKVEDQLAGKS